MRRHGHEPQRGSARRDGIGTSAKKCSAAAGRKPNSVPPSLTFAPCGARRASADDNHSSRPGIAGGLKRPTRRLRTGRPLSPTHSTCADAWRLPIWPCSVRGFACHLPYGRRGALLPHLFTLTRLRSPARRGSSMRGPARELEARSGRYIFCATVLRVAPTGRYPAHCPAGVRTFLPPSPPPSARARRAGPSTRDGEGRRSSGPLRRSRDQRSEVIGSSSRVQRSGSGSPSDAGPNLGTRTRGP